jgi:hypothetical protein
MWKDAGDLDFASVSIASRIFSAPTDATLANGDLYYRRHTAVCPSVNRVSPKRTLAHL